MKVLYLFDYSIEEGYRLWREQNFCDNVMYGLNRLSRYGIETAFVSRGRSRFLAKIIKRGGRWDVLQQLRSLPLLREYDLVFATGPNQGMVLSFLRSLSLVKTPLVIQCHSLGGVNSKVERALASIAFRGASEILYWAHSDYKRFVKLGVREEKLQYFEWGADLDFYQPRFEKGEYILSIGKEDRDYLTLCRAMEGVQDHLEIVCYPRNVQDVFRSTVCLKNVNILTAGFSYRQLLELYNRAKFVIIPLKKTRKTRGMGVLMGAMAMGKAIIMSRLETLDLDIEREGCGIFVEPENIEELARAMKYLLNHPEEVDKMGRRSRELVKTHYNSERFSRDLARIFVAVVSQNR